MIITWGCQCRIWAPWISLWPLRNLNIRPTLVSLHSRESQFLPLTPVPLSPLSMQQVYIQPIPFPLRQHPYIPFVTCRKCRAVYLLGQHPSTLTVSIDISFGLLEMPLIFHRCHAASGRSVICGHSIPQGRVLKGLHLWREGSPLTHGSCP